MNGPTKKKLRKKKNKTAIDCRLMLTEDFFYYNVTYNITAFFDSYKEKKEEKWCTRMF